ncbi:cell division initiation protein, partial [Streptomyces sp. NPDC013087]
PERSADPETLRRRADDYVDTKLGAFEAVLAKTLEAVGRGRQKLHGRVATDDLGAHMAAQDAAGGARHTSDEDHWAGLAELATPEPSRSPAQHSYAEPAQPDYAPVAGYQDPAQSGFPAQAQPDQQYAQTYGYQDQQQPQDAYGYQQQPDPYGYQQQAYDPNQQQDYGWQQQAQIPAQQGEGALDETSLFDTSMIDLDQLRRYEQGR